MSSVIRTFAGKIPTPLRRRILAPFNAFRFFNAYFGRQTMAIFPTLIATGETHNFTYDLTERNVRYLAETIAVVTGSRPQETVGYIEEAIGDAALNQRFQTAMRTMGDQPLRNLRSPFGRRLGWYAIARATKPKIVVETGVERGHGALLLCAALLRNADEGAPGHYIGTDINRNAGWLLSGKYASIGKILYGDSIESLKTLAETVDLFINDSDHSADYEYDEYKVIAPKLSAKAIVVGDNAHVTDKLALFSRENGRRFIFFKEEPKDHWYPGAGIGISFP
jgi:hypothetical protein